MMRRFLTVLGVLLGLTHAALAAPERVLAIYLPGVYFPQLERKLDLGSELATHLQKKLGDKYHLSARLRVRRSDGRRREPDCHDPHRVALCGAEPAQASAPGGGGTGSDTRLAVLATAAVRSLTDLKRGGLVYASPVEPPQAFGTLCV
ncbi:MAG: hypothetical protein U0745_05160 [Polyangia bacterium]